MDKYMTERNIDYIKKYTIIHKLINLFKVFIYTVLIIYIIDIVIKYYDNTIVVKHIDLLYVVFIFLIMLILESMLSFAEIQKLNKLVVEYNTTTDKTKRNNIYYKIIGYISIHRDYLLKRLIGGD